MAIQEGPVDLIYFQGLMKPEQNLLAVSKVQPAEKIRKLYAQGQRHFAENYIQEAIEKINALRDLDITWHLIGPIQKNKIKYLQKNFTYLHAIDSVAVAHIVAEKARAIDYRQKIFLQVNLSQESSKSGFSENELKLAWPQLKALSGIETVGLMTMPPLQNNAEENRSHFRQCRLLGRELGLKEFSMGTSHDFQVALEEGATWIRVGTLLFGEREKNDTSSAAKN
jgi:PLP dependent protein